MEKPERAELDRIRWRHLSFVVQGSMNTLNPVRRVRHAFVDFAFRHLALPMPELTQRVRAHLERLRLLPSVLDAYPHELSGGMASALPSRSPRSVGRNSSSRTSPPRRSTWWCRRTC